MKKIIIIVVLGFLAIPLSAQVIPEKKPSTLAFHVFYNDFNTTQLIRTSSLKNVLKNHLWTKIGAMQMGLGINYLKGIHKKVDFIASIDGSWTDYLFKDGTTNGSSQFLFDTNVGLNLKLLTDRHTLVPYLSSGIGFSAYQGKTGFYVPVGAGLQFNVFNEAFIFTNVQYRRALSTNVNDHFYYAIGVGLSIGKTKIEPTKMLDTTRLVEPVKIAKPIQNKTIVISVIDQETNLPLADVAVNLSGIDGANFQALTNAEGNAIFTAISPSDYSISGVLNQINTSSQNLAKDAFVTDNNQISLTLKHNDPQFTLKGVVLNKTQNMPEGDVQIKLTKETNQNKITKQSLTNTGIFQTQLEADSDFSLVGKKANFLSNIVKISTKGLNRNTTLYVNLELAIEETKVGQSLVLNNIYFEVGKGTLNTASSTDLDKVYQFLSDNTDIKLEIQGHTDNSGSLLLNNKLSQVRANSVVAYLTKKGVEKNRLTAKGFGPSSPIADNNTAEGRAKNRCVVMKIMAKN